MWVGLLVRDSRAFYLKDISVDHITPPAIVEPGSREVNVNTRIKNTITELIYVPNDVEDGEYLLNIQIAPFESDCAPSRPVLLRTT